MSVMGTNTMRQGNPYAGRMAPLRGGAVGGGRAR